MNLIPIVLMLFRNYLSPLSFVILCQDWKAIEIQSQNINQTIIVSIKRSRNIPVLAPDGLNSLGTHICTFALHWRHNGHDSVSNNQPHHCLLNRLCFHLMTSSWNWILVGLGDGLSIWGQASTWGNGDLLTENRKSSWCQLCSHWWHSRLS